MKRSGAGPTVLIAGAGVAGLTTALALHRAGVPCLVAEAVSHFDPIGAGINILPHATARLHALGLESELAKRAVETRESVFFNRFGQLIFREPAGRHAGFPHAQYSIHRADLHDVLLTAVRERLGPDAVLTGHRLIRVTQRPGGVTAHFDGRGELDAEVLVGADGIHSAVRRQLFPDEGEPRYSGVTMWRGVSTWPSFLSGASMVRAGWLTTGKLVVYPVRDLPEQQLVNWVAELETPRGAHRDWTRRGELDDFLPAFADWRFDWLDVPAMLAAASQILLFPMVDQDPLPRWSHGRVTLLGDSAHPMVPRGSNGAGQAILDAAVLAECLAAQPGDPVAALEEYDRRRRPPTSEIVLLNRRTPPDAILREVYERTGDRPFRHIDDVVSQTYLAEIAARYRVATGQVRTA
ncbi:flavin-dependent oxidoreductase [Dactylosporangium sp. NPDC049525]|uniref:flavin-dependent oxidoreductase n=1 Tax=Dactylosporangium sp. NPDC049525 TaxID=3154730 RepID=UPI003418A6A3